MSQLRENQKLLPYGRFMLGFQSPNDEHLLEGIAKSEQNAGNKILIGEISKWVVIWLLYPIPMTFMVHSTIQCPEKQPFFGIILEPKEQSIHTTKRWWKLPTHSSFRRYVVNSYDINIKKVIVCFNFQLWSTKWCRSFKRKAQSIWPAQHHAPCWARNPDGQAHPR